MSIRRRALLQAAATGAVGLPAFARAADPTLKVWINGDKGWHGLAHATAAFERDTGVAVHIEHPEDAIAKFEQAAAAGKGPDVWIWPHDRLGSWSSAARSSWPSPLRRVTPCSSIAPTCTGSRFIFGEPRKVAANRLAGSRYSDSGVPTCATLPCDSTSLPLRSSTILSASVIASTWSCVT